MNSPAKTAIITGASSFVGCHLAQTFAKAGYGVVATTTRDPHEYEGIRAERLAAVRQVTELTRLDLTDGEAVAALIGLRQPDLWVHHAGYADHYHALDHDLARSLAVNVVPLAALYAALAGTGCGVIITGSSAEYSASTDANREDDACWPDLPYGTAKLAESLEARRLALLHGVPTRVARLYIPFGPLDNPQKLLAQVMAALQSGKPIDLSPCTQKRDFIAVADVGTAYMKLAEDMPRKLFDIFNICAGEAVALRALLEQLAGIMGADKRLLRFGAIAMRPGETPISYGANSKARNMLNWQPQPFDTALATLLPTETRP